MNFPIHQRQLSMNENVPEWICQADREIRAADGFVVILSSEYNCAVSPALINMLQHFPQSSYKHRPCSVVTYSTGIF